MEKRRSSEGSSTVMSFFAFMSLFCVDNLHRIIPGVIMNKFMSVVVSYICEWFIPNVREVRDFHNFMHYVLLHYARTNAIIFNNYSAINN